MSGFPLHPGGQSHTLRLLQQAEKAGLAPGAGILDLGAGDGGTVRLLRERGYEALGLDLNPPPENTGAPPVVLRGDFLHAPFPEGRFDAVISQCAFYISGDILGALGESFRLLKAGGLLLLSDVAFDPLRSQTEAAGFRVLWEEDMTPLWKEYYIEALWQGVPLCDTVSKKKCAYTALVCRKDVERGSI